VKTDTSSWSINRDSSNLRFDYEQLVQGQISPVIYRGRTLSPYHSFYEDVKVNDVCIKERTAALEGSYNSEELLSLRSSINDSVNQTIYKPVGSDIYTIHFYETWPVKLNRSKSMTYSGKGINNRDFAGNNHDFIGADFLYSKEFSKEHSLNMSLYRLNATVLATDEAIQHGEIEVTRDTQYKLQAHSTGIANFKYRQVGIQDEILNEGDEMFVGVYDIAKNLHMSSRFDRFKKDDDWLPCCYGGYLTMPASYQMSSEGFGSNVRGVFDCTCSKVPSVAELQRISGS
jgi:hypothetical protein